MPIRIQFKDGKPDTVEVDTLDEAFGIFNRFPQSSAPSTNGNRAPRQRRRLAGQRDLGLTEELSDSAIRLLRMIVDNRSGASSRVFAESLGVEPRGLGPLVAQISRWGGHHGMTKTDIVVKERKKGPDGTLVRVLIPGKAILRRLQEGSISLPEVSGNSQGALGLAGQK